MNLAIADTVKRCFECQISTETKQTEAAKMTKLPSRPWTTVEVDFCGPLFPNGRYALVVTDQYSRYPEVEFTTTTSFEATRKKLKKIFATHGVPQNLQSDNGPPFNSHAFSDFARESGFRHKLITPRHPKAQGQVEGFNKLVNKIMTIARHDRTNPDEAIYDMLQAYRSTPHPATKVPPYQLLMNREVRTKLDHFPTETHQDDKKVRENDSKYKS
jgi:transposase InsO family protein